MTDHDHEPHWARALHEKIDRVIHLLARNLEMSETMDTALSEISAKLDKLATDLAADLANIQNGPLNATQQAAVDAIKAKIDAMEATVLPPAPTP